jgi:hypothetical protein
MATTPTKPDPYCSFKDDHERRKALTSRDIRDVLIALVIAAVVGLLFTAGPISMAGAALVNSVVKYLRR